MAIRLARSLLVLVVLTPLVAATSRAATIDPAAMAYRLPATIEWRDNPNNPGVKSAVLYGDPANTIPMPAGSFVTHFGGKIHYDGAKDEEAVLQIHGMGPATTTYVHAGH